MVGCWERLLVEKMADSLVGVLVERMAVMTGCPLVGALVEMMAAM